MAYTNKQLREWVNNPERNGDEYRTACRGLGLQVSGKKDELKERLNAAIDKEAETAKAKWSPAGAPSAEPSTARVPRAARTPPPNGGSNEANSANGPPHVTLIGGIVNGYRDNWVPWALIAGFLFLLLIWPAWFYRDRNPVWTQDDPFSRGQVTAAKGDSDVVKTTNRNRTNSGGQGGTTSIPAGGNAAVTGPCQLDKVGTWSEGNPPYRIEVGGHGGQHFDFYPNPPVKAVSFVVHPIANPSGVPDIAWGYGSMWEGDKPECANFDYVADAIGYAKARLDSGHSGLVVEWGTWKVLANVANLSQDQIDRLIATDRQAMNGPLVSQTSSTGSVQSVQPAVAAPAPARAPAPAPAQPAPAQAPQAQAPQAQACGDGVRGTDFTPQNGVNWNPGSAGDWRVVNFWTNWPGQPQGDRKVLLAPGDPGNLPGGGSYWSWPASCGEAAQKAYNANSFAPLR